MIRSRGRRIGAAILLPAAVAALAIFAWISWPIPSQLLRSGLEPGTVLRDREGRILRDARAVTRTPPYGPPGTFTGFDIMRAPALPIDHIFVTRAFAVDSYAVITQHWGGRLPSDHYPVVADLRPFSR